MRCSDIRSANVIDERGQVLYARTVLKQLDHHVLSDGRAAYSSGTYYHVENIPRSEWHFVTERDDVRRFPIPENPDGTFGPLPAWYVEYVCQKGSYSGQPNESTAPGELSRIMSTLASYLERNLQVMFPGESVAQSITRGRVLRTLGGERSPLTPLHTFIYKQFMAKVSTTPPPADFWKAITKLSWADLEGSTPVRFS